METRPTGHLIAVGDRVMFDRGHVMRVAGIGDVLPGMVTLISDANPDGDRECTLPIFLRPLPGDGETITCWGCLWQTHLWIDATMVNRWTGVGIRMIRCSRCFVSLRHVRDCEIHAMSSTVWPEDLHPRQWR